jgi:hypothetical protein
MQKPARCQDKLVKRCALITLKQFEDLRQFCASAGRGQA